ncbi:hypothetical protein D3C76_1013270 [compost metagenome]
MNVIMRTKIETCLELSRGAKDFRTKVFKVTGLTDQGFKGLALTQVTFERLTKGDKKADILRELF